MNIKDGVDLRGLNWRMRRALQVAEHIFRTHGFDLTVTSGLDGEHSTWSWHYYGMAVDLRTFGLSLAEVHLLAADLRDTLGRPYQVVIEPTHIHVECDLDANPDLVGVHP